MTQLPGPFGDKGIAIRQEGHAPGIIETGHDSRKCKGCGRGLGDAGKQQATCKSCGCSGHHDEGAACNNTIAAGR